MLACLEQTINAIISGFVVRGNAEVDVGQHTVRSLITGGA